MTQSSVLHFFAGKGGAGKTTLATAYALNSLERNGKARVLLTTLEQNSGLGDLLKKTLGPKPTKLAPGKGTGALFASELNLPTLAEAFNKTWKPALMGVAVKGALFTDEDLKKIFEASTLNIGELAAIFHLIDLAESGEWEEIYVDCASMSHVTRLFDHVTNLRKLIGLVRGEHKFKATKSAPPRPATTVDAWATKADAALAFLKDPKRFAFHLCTVAEPVADVQTRWLVKALADRGIPLADIIADQIEVRVTTSREVANRRGLQAPHVRRYMTLSQKVDLVERRIIGPRGLDEVKKFSKELATGKEQKSLQFTPAEAPPALVRAPSMPPIAAPPLPPTRFIFFVGSGGTGKSSCAAAAAVTLTEKEGPVLLLSTDPAHSLSEVLLARLTDTETQVKGTKGLYAREIDHTVWFNGLRKKFREFAEAMFGPEVKGEPFVVEREVFRHLLEFAPVGIDELAALSSLTDALVQERFKRIVIDPPSTTDMIRVLELAPTAKAWLNAVLGVASKHKAKGAAALVAYCEATLKHIDRFEKAILNPAECRFVIVTRGEEVSTPAAERTVEYIKKRNLPLERVLVNRVLPKTTDAVTEERRANELENAKSLEKRLGMLVTCAPALGRHPAGLRELKAFRTSWYALTAAANKTKAA